MVAYACCFQVDALERAARAVFRSTRSTNDSRCLINRIPSEVLLTIPEYFAEHEVDRSLIALTQICHGWREMFISCPELWTALSCTDIDKTRTYIQRSRSLPLEIRLGSDKVIAGAFGLVIPNVHPLKSLAVERTVPRSVFEHLRCLMPLLQKLDLDPPPWLYLRQLSNVDLSSLSELHLRCDIRPTNLRAFSFSLDRILDFLKSVPLLHTLHVSLPPQDPCDAQHEQRVKLPHLKALSIIAMMSNRISLLLGRLRIPANASITCEFRLRAGEFPLPDHLLDNLPDLSRYPTVNLLFGAGEVCTQLSGPAGRLRVLTTLGHKKDWNFLHFLGKLNPQNIERLSILGRGFDPFWWEQMGANEFFETLFSMRKLQTLRLIGYFVQRFILGLDPKEDPYRRVPCPNLRKLVICEERLESYTVRPLVKMTRHRAAKGAELSLIKITGFCTCDRKLTKELALLKKQATRPDNIVCNTDYVPFPEWDDVSGILGGEN